MRRSYIKQCHLYKLVHGLPFFLTLLLATTSFSHSYPTCSSHNLSLHVGYPPPTQRVIFCDAICTWNLLPYFVMSLPSLNLFKRLSKHLQQLCSVKSQHTYTLYRQYMEAELLYSQQSSYHACMQRGFFHMEVAIYTWTPSLGWRVAMCLY